jgi:sugar phosphate isomerase/epimerase
MVNNEGIAMNRRQFLATSAAAPLAAGAAAGPRLGVDMFSLRSQGWTPFQSLDYCSKFSAKVVHFSEIRFLGSLDEQHMKKVGEHARNLGIELEIGMRSICPTSTAFDPKQGTAEEQLTAVLKAAKTAGSKLVRAFLGTMADRKTPGGIEARIADTVKVLRAVRSLAQDLGLKIAIENHAGDMQARELKTLIEEAGKDVVGACYDSGNPCWVLEDPHLTLETLAPHILTAHIRDSYLWNTDEGTMVNWTRMGEGNVDMEGLLRKFVTLCPGKTMSLEVIVMGPRPYAWRKPEFWDGYRNVPAWEFSRFISLGAKGTPRPAPAKPASKEESLAREREDFEVSMAWTRKFFDA